MKIHILISAIFSFIVSSSPQSNQEAQRLMAEIKKCDYIESYCLGFACNSYSELYKKADSLFALSTLNGAVNYFNDTSYSLKYYSFLYILDHNDSLAFQLLTQNISDKRAIDYTFADMSGNTKFSHLIINEYRNFIKMKYLYGGHATLGGHRSLNFPTANKSVYKKRSRELDQLLANNNIHFR
ncbi:MAG: hypothetical protein ABI480_18375 [Chitinophagaceae bacterium]